MAEGRIFKKNLEIRLKTLEEQLVDIFSRIGLLDEQARQASYRALLAMAQCEPSGPVTHEGAEGFTRRLTETRATRSPRDDRDGGLTSRRSASTTR